MKTKALELIDFEKVDTLLEGFNKTTGFVSAILDLEGNVLTRPGYRQISIDLDLLHDSEFSSQTTGGQKHQFNKYLNGLMDVVAPIVINGEHIANLVSGQFFFEKPDHEFLKKQAHIYGFNEKEYLTELDKVPVVSKEQVRTTMDFLLNMILLIGEMSMAKIERVEKALRKSEEMMRNSQSVAHICSYSTDLTEADISKNQWVCSPEFYKIFGIDKSYPHTIAGWAGFIHPDYREEMMAYHESVIKEKKSFNYDYKIIRIDDGEERWVHGTGKLEYDKTGNPIRMHGAIQDITERKRIEEALRENEEKYRSLAENTSDVIAIMDLQGTITYMSRKVEEETGYKKEEIEGFSIQKILTPASYEVAMNRIRKRLSGENITAPFEVDIVNKSGTFTPFELNTSAITKNGEIAGIEIVARNITERKKAEKALKESENRFRSLLQDIPSISVQGYQMDGRVIYWNEASEKLYGYTSEEALGQNLLDLIIPPELQEQVKEEIRSMSQSRKSIPPAELSLLRKDGSQVPVFTNHAILNRDGENPELFCVDLDLTKIKNAERLNRLQYNLVQASIRSKKLEGLFESVKNELNSVIDAKNILIAFYDEETGILSAKVDENEKDQIQEWPLEKSLSGYAIRQNKPVLLRKNEITRLHEEGIIELFGTTAEAWLGVPLKVEGSILGIVVVQNYDNADIYDQTSVEIMELVAHELSIFIDRQRNEEKTNKLSRAVEQSSVSVVITNRDGCIEYVNSFFTKLTGYRLEEAKGKTPNILKTDHQTDAFYKELWNTILSGNDWEGEILNKKKNGDFYWVKTVISPIVSNEGVITHFVSIEQDITERKKMLEELVTTKEKAVESDRLKTRFLNNMSHEIRTPMNGIIGFSDLLDEPDLSEERRKYYSKIIQNSSHQLLRIIDDILEISTLETKQEKTIESEFCLNDFLMEIFSIFNLKSKERNIPLYLKKGLHDDQSFIISDKTKLNKILSNLIENALKFTNEGHVEFGYFIENEGLKLYVKDTGIGISPKNHQKIFDRFSQEDKEIASKHGGLGLGLSISKENAQLLGGDITLQSEKGLGSVFFITIPYKPAKANSKNKIEKADEHLDNKTVTILIAEDEEVNYLFIEALFEAIFDRNYQLIHAVNGKEAVDLCIEDNRIDLVLMDIKMPEMNGHEATERIKSKFPNLPVIAQTAYSTESDKQLALKHGCDDFISKPINKERLFHLIDKYLTIK
jgi:PAS domain S-box-containing protein